MSYTPPNLDSVNLELEAYTPPPLDEVNFELAVIEVISPPLGLWIRKRLGRPEWPDPLGVSGIYRIQRINGRKVQQKLPHYSPVNPKTEDQLVCQNKFADAVAAWQGLTEEQKNVYNSKTYPRHQSGYNKFLSEYLKS
jgi:hypothetical protein